MKVLLALLFALLLRPVLSDDVPFCHAANCSAVSSNPVDCNPVDCKPVDCKPVNCKPVNSNPVDCKPVNCIPVDCQPVSCNCNPVECIPIPCLSTSAWKDPNTYIGGIVVFMMTIPLSYILYVFHFYQYAEKTVHQKMKNGWNWLWGRGKGEDDLEAGRLIEEPETDHANPELRVETAQPIREAHVETGRENREADLGADQDGQETYRDTNQGKHTVNSAITSLTLKALPYPESTSRTTKTLLTYLRWIQAPLI